MSKRRLVLLAAGLTVAFGGWSPRRACAAGIRTVEVDLSRLAGSCKMFQVTVTNRPVKVVVKNGRFSDDAWFYVWRMLRRYREQLELGVKHRQGRIYRDLLKVAKGGQLGRTPTGRLYEEAKRYVKLAGKDTDEFWKPLLRTKDLYREREFFIRPEVSAYRSIRLDPCYRKKDLARLKRVLVRASQKYIEAVDKVRQDVERERALRERARKAAKRK